MAVPARFRTLSPTHDARSLCAIALISIWFVSSGTGCCGDCVTGFDRRCPDVVADVRQVRSGAILAWGYGGVPAFDGGSRHAVTLLFEPVAGATEGYLGLRCNSFTDPDVCNRIDRFCVGDAPFEPAFGLLAIRTTDVPGESDEDDLTYMVAFDADTSVHASNQVRSRISTKPTVLDRQIVTLYSDPASATPTDSPDATPVFRWSGRGLYPNVARTVIAIVDASGAAVAAVSSAGSSWEYGGAAERTIVQPVPLVAGSQYTATTWLLDDGYWALAVDKTVFVPR